MCLRMKCAVDAPVVLQGWSRIQSCVDAYVYFIYVYIGCRWQHVKSSCCWLWRCRSLHIVHFAAVWAGKCMRDPTGLVCTLVYPCKSLCGPGFVGKPTYPGAAFVHSLVHKASPYPSSLCRVLLMDVRSFYTTGRMSVVHRQRRHW